MNVPPSARPPLTLSAGDDTDVTARVARQKERLCALARLDSVRIAEESPQGAVQFVVDGVSAGLAIADFIDLAAERARLEKAIVGFENDIQRVARKLDNAEFMAKAPESVVQENQEKRAEAEAAKAKMAAALARLAAVG